MQRMQRDDNFSPGDASRPDSATERIALLASNMRAVQSSEEAADLPEGFQPGPTDVICARGKKAFLHSGNLHFRATIESQMDRYSSTGTKLEKSLIVSHIVDEIRQASPGGGFVKQEKGRWLEVGDHAAREKVGQSFRDLLHSKYRSSTKAKKLRRCNSDGDAVKLFAEKGVDGGGESLTEEADGNLRQDLSEYVATQSQSLSNVYEGTEEDSFLHSQSMYRPDPTVSDAVDLEPISFEAAMASPIYQDYAMLLPALLNPPTEARKSHAASANPTVRIFSNPFEPDATNDDQTYPDDVPSSHEPARKRDRT